MALTTRVNFRTEFDFNAAGAASGQEYTAAHPDDDRIDRLMDSVTSLCQSFTDQQLEQATHTLLTKGTGSNILVLPEQPATAITSVHESTDTPRVYGADELLVADTDYVLDTENGILHRLGGNVWPTWVNSVKVIYTAGWAVVPGDLERACLEIMRTKLTKGKDGLYIFASKAGGEGSVTTFKDSDIPHTAMRVLAKYARAW